MNVNLIDDNIFLFTFDTQKELVLSFFRPQEFYESNNEKLHQTNFSFFDFLDENLDKDGNINYFSFWNGFNIPSDHYEDWLFSDPELSPYEKAVYNAVSSHLRFGKPFYIIGTIENDEETINHEMAHALFNTNTSYKNRVLAITTEFEYYNNTVYDKIVNRLSEMGYRCDVLEDEVQAYFSAECEEYLSEEFQIDNFDDIRQFTNKFKNNLQQYLPLLTHS